MTASRLAILIGMALVAAGIALFLIKAAIKSTARKPAPPVVTAHSNTSAMYFVTACNLTVADQLMKPAVQSTLHLTPILANGLRVANGDPKIREEHAAQVERNGYSKVSVPLVVGSDKTRIFVIGYSANRITIADGERVFTTDTSPIAKANLKLQPAAGSR